MAEESSAWWDELPEDFYRQREGTPIDSAHPLLVNSSAAADHVLRNILGGLISTGMAPGLLRPARFREREQGRAAQYREYAARADVDAVFRPPPAGVPTRVRKAGLLDFRPARRVDTRIVEFDSPYRTLLPEMQAEWDAMRGNRRAQFMHWRHADGPRHTLVFTHGFFASDYWFNSWMFSLPWFFDSGYDIVLNVLPFHGRRQEPRAPFSGFGFVDGGFSRLNEAMMQSVHDTRIILDYLQDYGAPSVGVSGLSLGGYVSSLLACVDERLAYCIPNSAVVNPTDMGLEWLSLGWAVRANMKLGEVTLPEARQSVALHSPLTYKPRIAPKRLMIIGGAGDRITPPRYLRLLHEHWPGSHLHWFPGNHVIHLGQRRYLKLMRWFMDRHSGIVR